MLENIDKKILYSLDGDSAKSLTKISKEIGISPQLVKYHLNKLEKEEIILAYWPMVEFRKLGYSNASYFLKLKNLSDEAEKEMIKYLRKINDFNIAMRGDGYWDLHITISTRNIFRSVEVFNRFYDKFHKNILSYDTAISVGFYQFRREYLNLGKKADAQERMALTGADVEFRQYSRIFLKLIEALNRDCRQSFSDLAKDMKISRDRAVYYFKKVKKEKIIQSNTYLLDHEKIGYPRYRVLLQLRDFTSEKYADFFLFCRKDPNIIHFLRLFGNWQALIDVEIESPEKLRKLFREITRRYGDFVLRLESTRVYKIDKFRDIPMKIAS
jgi:DNA-binding Lrp family transcriptional regulator